MKMKGAEFASLKELMQPTTVGKLLQCHYEFEIEAYYWGIGAKSVKTMTPVTIYPPSVPAVAMIPPPDWNPQVFAPMHFEMP